VLRHYIPIAFALAAIACEPSIPQTPPPAAINYAVFDLSAAKIPQPNDLTLQPSVIAGLPDNAQREFLSSLATSGGFPNDQELPVTIDLQRVNVAANGKVTLVAPTLDVASITSSNLVALQVDATNTPSVAQLEPVTASAYAVNGDHGTLTLFHKGHKPWPAGVRIIIALRGGGDGVTVQNGEMLQAAPNLYLLLQNSDLSQPQNTALLPGTRSQQLAEGAQLEQIRQQYQPIFKALDALFFPHTELASLTTFQIAPAKSAQVVTDPAAGIIPIPSDLLLDASGKHVQNIAAFGPLAGGIATLDGFSTTAPISAQTSGPVLAATITKDTVLLYDLSNPAAPVRVPDATQPGGNYVSEPPQVTQMVQGVSVSTLIALQPAVAVPGPNGALALPPLKEATEYAVIVTDGVKDVNQKGLSRSTLSSVLLFQHPIVDAAGKSQLQGIDDATAASLDRIRLMLKPALGQLKTDTGMDTSHVAIAYTFRTQSITGVGALSDPSKPVGLLQLAALPYADPVASANFVPTAPTSFTAAEAFANYGIDTTIVPLGNIAEVLEAKMPTVNLLSNATGAFDPTQSTHEIINVLMAIPQAANVPACPTGGPYPPGAKCAPLVVFHHGLGGSRGNMLEVADSLTAQGFVVAAIDSPKHGDRRQPVREWEQVRRDSRRLHAGRCNRAGHLRHGLEESPDPLRHARLSRRVECVDASGRHCPGIVQLPGVREPVPHPRYVPPGRHRSFRADPGPGPPAATAGRHEPHQYAPGTERSHHRPGADLLGGTVARLDPGDAERRREPPHQSRCAQRRRRHGRRRADQCPELHEHRRSAAHEPEHQAGHRAVLPVHSRREVDHGPGRAGELRRSPAGRRRPPDLA
jgi:hypothetical protein